MKVIRLHKGERNDSEVLVFVIHINMVEKISNKATRILFCGGGSVIVRESISEIEECIRNLYINKPVEDSTIEEKIN